MKAINFNAIEILPALLSRKKVQMIEPDWKEVRCIDGLGNMQSGIDKKGFYVDGTVEKEHQEFIGKPPRFKVGEQVKLRWKQKSKYLWFTRNDGKGKTLWINPPDPIPKEVFSSVLGTAEITEVFKIEMNKYFAQIPAQMMDEDSPPKLSTHRQYSRVHFKGLDWENNFRPGSELIIDNSNLVSFCKNLAKSEGFPSVEVMFTYFDKKYDLTNPKQFWVYRWKWLK